MKIRVKAVFIIMIVVFVVIMSYTFLSLFFTRENLVATMEQDMFLARDIADDLVTTTINLLKSNAATIAERLLKAESKEEMLELIELYLDEFQEFTSLTVYDRDGILVNGGEDIYNDEMHDNYLSIAFDGGTIISTTHYNGTGSFIMHVFVPMRHDLVLSTTFSGMTFADLISDYRLWHSGSIYLLDETGAVIAHYRRELVLERHNYIEEAKTNPELTKIGDFFQRIISSPGGSGTYPFEGKERFCTYKRVSGSISGWCIVVSVPLSESPLGTLQRGLLFAALCFLGMGVIVAAFISSLVVQPYYKIEEQNQNLAELNEIVVAASKAKSNFLANMSHEMRTPLNAVIGLSELTLGSGELSSESSLNLEKIFNAGITLLSTVNDILDISKIEAGKFELIPVRYDIPSLINDAITQSILHIGEKPINFVLNIDENLPTSLYGDDLRVKQILNNLLSNAFKYTKEGTVEMNISCEREGEQTVWVTVCIRDTGPGIINKDLDNLFSDYSQFDKTSNRTIQGTGLGLPITKRLTEMMDGSITAESEHGKGSVFTARFKQQFVTDAKIGKEMVNNLKNFRYSETKRDRNLRLARIQMPYARVLVVDDVVTNLDVAKGMLKPYGMQIDCVISGQQAIDAIQDQKVKYKAVFMDHMMPGMDGIEAARLIRETGTDYAKNIPIIALTANAIVGNEEMFLNKGFQAFISKPIEFERLDTVLREWVRDKELEKALEDRQSCADEQNLSDTRSGTDRRSLSERRSGIDRRTFGKKVKGIDLDKGLKRFGDDEELFLQVLHSYALNTRPLLETLKNVNIDNLSEYAVTIHGIKGSSLGICAEMVSAAAEVLEKAAKQNDYNFVSSNNETFIESLEELINSLDEALKQMASDDQKPEKDKPDKHVLSKLIAACETYDMDGVDAAMEEIDQYKYEADDGLVTWLKENVDLMNLTQIREKLVNMAG